MRETWREYRRVAMTTVATAPGIERRASTDRRPLRVTDEHALRAFWYPVGRGDALGENPVARRLLGVEVVVWRTPGGVAAAIDRCPHRDARLSCGWTSGERIVCPYHGWEFGTDGVAAHIPQLDDGVPVPPGARIGIVDAAERYGWVWVCLDAENAPPLPDLDGEWDASWRIVHEPESEWSCPAPLLVENNLDPSHIAFVHRESFGSPAVAKIPALTVERVEGGLRTRSEVPVQARPGEPGATVRHSTTRVRGAFLMIIRIEYPDGVTHVMVKACTPVDDASTRQLQFVVRSDREEQRPAADIVAFDAQVWDEDRAVLETAHHDFFLDLTANVHLRVDRPSIEYRRMLRELVDRS
jgi:phenylpropionate dioxygenase-like ring-hydroxylating dioxygenase large terminal subunit